MKALNGESLMILRRADYAFYVLSARGNYERANDIRPVKCCAMDLEAGA